MPGPALLDLMVRAVRPAATDVLSLELARPDGTPLPEWQPGAHVDLHLPSGLVRSYSLHGDPADRCTYRIGVLRATVGRGGSAEVHQIARQGVRLAVGGPRNNFGLEPASHYLFLAGGIGVTPLLAMARQVATSGVPWSFVYGGRNRASMAFIDELRELSTGQLQIVAQDEDGLPDLAAAFAVLPPGSAVYCCGPGAMIDAVLAFAHEQRPDITVRLERFTAAVEDRRETDTAFDVTLAQSQTTVHVPVGTTILQAVRTVCPTVMSSCEEGVCSACETEVLQGLPDHRDSVLTPRERASNRYMMICVSRALSEHLVLDL